jgi:hypothetical protein
LKINLHIPNPLCIFADMNNPKEHLIPSTDQKSHVFRGMSSVMAKLYPYRHLTNDELKVGTKCQRRLFGEFDTEICGPTEITNLCSLNDEIGWTWIDCELAQEDLEFLAHGGLNGNGFSANGFFRIKK